MLGRDTSSGRHSSRVASRRSACLRSHVLRAYCIFENKVISIFSFFQIIYDNDY